MRSSSSMAGEGWVSLMARAAASGIRAERATRVPACAALSVSRTPCRSNLHHKTPRGAGLIRLRVRSIPAGAMKVAAWSSAGRSTSYLGRNRVRIVADAYGDPNAPAVVLLHGGGQTRHAWGSTARALGEAGWHALALDLRGHGDSAWDPLGDYSL